MTTTIEHAEILERTIKYKYNEADEFCTQSLHIKPTEIQCREAAQRLRELEKDAVRYRWLCDKGHSYHGAVAGTGSMSICRGPYILLELPSHNKFSNMILTKQAADVIIDKAISEEAQ
jgi:hypothetical protein